MGWRFSLPDRMEKAVIMEVKLYVGNLPEVMSGKELSALFAHAGDVTEVEIITDRQSGRSKGYAFVTMSALSEADKAVSMFNACFLNEYRLKVTLVKRREQRGLGR